MPVIQAENLTKIFGKKPARGLSMLRDQGLDRPDLKKRGYTAAVIDATFDVNPGEIFVVMGLSGSGKSTLIRMVNGLLDPTAGSLRIGDTEIVGANAKTLRDVRRKRVSMVFQNFALLPHRTVGENAAYALAIQGVGKSEREKRAREALAMVGLEGWGGSFPHELSGGMRQRVGLARALASETDILLMDEAFSALDPLIRRDMQDQLMDLQQRLNKTILFITHDLNEAMRLGGRIAMMRDGRIVQVGTAEEILNNPANDYVSQFVQDVDRSKVLTAEAICEKPQGVLRSDQGPRTAHKLLREAGSPWLVVVDSRNKPVGTVWEDDVAAAVKRGSEEIPYSQSHAMPVVNASTPIGDLFADSAKHLSPLVVVNDETGQFLGVIPRVTLLAAVGSGNGNDGVATLTSGIPTVDGDGSVAVDPTSTTKGNEQ